jgi:uncharacterized protein YprB with RNaseH-like and TPR domain
MAGWHRRRSRRLRAAPVDWTLLARAGLGYLPEPVLTRTFCHVPGIGPGFEQRLWSQGIHTWEDALRAELPGARGSALRETIGESVERLERGDVRHFGGCLAAREQWRLFAQFRGRAAYLDIETTGLGAPDDVITTIALYDGTRVRHYVRGQNLDEFADDVAAIELLITYNGRSFDLPFLRRALGLRLDQAHIDLMHLLRGLGYRGGLKSIERQLGLERTDMADIDGFFAVVLWHEYRRTREPRVLETLLAYNVQDVINLEPLMVFAFNRKLGETPFEPALRLPTPRVAPNPFRAHRDVVERLRSSASW